MSETHFDEFEHYNFTEDNKLYSNHSGRLRTKKVLLSLCSFVAGIAIRSIELMSFDTFSLQEAEQHTNRFDPNGHTRKIEIKLHNTEKNRRAENVSTSKSK